MQARTITPGKTGQDAIKKIVPWPFDTRSSPKEYGYKDPNNVFPELHSIGREDASNPKSNKRSKYLSASVDVQEDFKSYLTCVRQRQFKRNELTRKSQSPKFEGNDIRLYPGITQEGMKRLLNNTFSRINREQAQRRTLAAQKGKLVLNELSEYDEKPIRDIVQEKHRRTVRNHYHDLDKVPDSKINEMRVERMLKKLDKGKLMLKKSDRRSPRSFMMPNVESLARSDRYKSLEMSSVGRYELDETIPAVDRSLAFTNETIESPNNATVFEKTESPEVRTQNALSNRLESLRVQLKNPQSRRNSQAALPPVKLSAMSIVKNPFPVQALESFIYDNFETSPTNHSAVHNPPIVLRSKLNNSVNTSIDQSERSPLDTIANTVRSRLETRLVPKGLTSRRGVSSINSKDKSSLEREELSSIFQGYRKELESVYRNSTSYIKELDCFNNYLRNDHNRLKASAEKVVPLNQQRLNLELESIKTAVLHEIRVKTRMEEVMAERIRNRLKLLGEKALDKEPLS